MSFGIGNLGKFLANRTSVVTGSTSGIGLGIATVLAQHGSNLVLNGIESQNDHKVNELVKRLSGEHGVRVEYMSADLSKAEQVRGLISNSYDAFKSVDVLVNNAGIQFVSPVDSFPDEKWDQIVAINLSSAFHATKAALPLMKQHGFGRIINLASAHGLVASHNKAPYVATKHGLVGFTKSVALETATTDDLTVNSVCPGFVLTPLVHAQIIAKAKELGVSEEEASKDLLSKHPSGKFITPDDLGNLCAFLCSPYATQLTGQAIAMDGGWTAI